MKFQHIAICFLVANVALASWWSIILTVVNTIRNASTSLCGSSIVAGNVPAAAVSCAITAVAAAIGVVAQAVINAKGKKGRSNVDLPPLSLNGKPTDFTNLPVAQWLDVSYDDTPVAVILGPSEGEVSAGVNFGSYESGNPLGKRDDATKDMYIEAHNVTGIEHFGPSQAELLQIASGVLEQGAAFPGEYRIHLARPDNSASMDLLVRTGMSDYKPSFIC